MDGAYRWVAFDAQFLGEKMRLEPPARSIGPDSASTLWSGVELRWPMTVWALSAAQEHRRPIDVGRAA
jgi:hypothetical protein